VTIGSSTNIRSSTNETRGWNRINFPNSWLIVVAGTVLLITVAWIISGHNEIDACNAESVKQTLMNGTFQKAKDGAVKYWSTGSSTPEILETLQNWTAEIVNIRQLSYDSTNNVRFCEADFEYRNIPRLELILPLLFAKDPSCSRAVQYKVEPLLDRPGRIYVSWVCLPQ
jgi:hypothetical protein